MNQAYLYACSYDITTIRHINDTRLEDTLTRAEFAKIISNYVRYNLDREPDTSRVANFADSDEVNSELAGYVEMAYQYGLMGINMPDNRFLVNDTISRAEVSTILSRLYELALDGTGDTPYYRPHMDAMLDAGFITLDDPTLSEVRGYLFIMLERIAEAYL